MKQKTILIVEDDTDINNLIAKLLRIQGYIPIQSFSGTEASLRLEMDSPDLILLDLMLPGMSGEEFLGFLREKKKLQIPVIVLSAKAELEKKVTLLKNGADDYVTKPFEPEELLARVYAALRRHVKEDSDNRGDSYVFKNLKLVPESRKVLVKEKEICLTPHEYEILYLLLQEPAKVYSRESLYEQVWRGGYYGEDNTVNVHVSNIRKKIAVVDKEEEYIKTVWGIGFKLA